MLPKPKKLNPNNKFQPLPVDAGDECFRNGIFEFNITKLLAFIKNNPDKFPVEEVDGTALRYGDEESLDEATIKTANLSAPINLAEISPGRFNVVDGSHRVERAHREGVEKIPAYRVGAADHQAFLTSERGYKAYIDYWNSKIDDITKR
jgi:ParB-like nuclease domain